MTFSLLSSVMIDITDAHGYMTSPRSRNWYASEDGVDGWDTVQSPGVPPKENCPHCLNGNEGVCGKVSNGGRSYDPFLDSEGNIMPWLSQANYNEGQNIVIKSYLDTHHNGHMTISACPDGPASTQDCFDKKENFLTFVSDMLYDMPADPNYPERGYYAGGQGGGLKSFEFLYKLPDGIYGNQVMLQWKYITANSCSPPGYSNYFSSNSLPGSYWTSGLTDCTPPYPSDGTRSTTWPEQFFNCAEVTVHTSEPTPPPVPTTPAPVAPVAPTTPAPVSPTTPWPTASPPTSSGQFCCSQNFKDCVTYCGTTKNECKNCGVDVFWVQPQDTSCEVRYAACTGRPDACCNGLTCVGDEYYAQCKYVASPPTTGPVPTEPPVMSPAPTKTPNVPTVPTTPAPTSSPEPTSLFSCSEGTGKSSWEALLALEQITYQVSDNPHVLSVVASGGAAGDGSFVVSESQAYGVLAAGLALVSMDVSNIHYDETKRKFEGYFNGWREMCRNSAPASCQNPTYCDGGSSPCLPGWKHLADFSGIEGTGAAPDGDEDAIIGMIMALKAVESDSVQPSWYEEVKDWADASCTQFLQDNTKLSSSGSHRLLKLGSCWGGWGSDGNNPSYHAPGHYRMMRDFQESIKNRAYALPSFVNTDSWNMLIDTSYKFLGTTQCHDTGLVPNWALVSEVDSQTLANHPGSFSGSGTPQYEFGAEASRTMWRIAFDAAAYPVESAVQSGPFLTPLHNKLVSNFNPSPLNGWEYFGEGSLEACSPLVSNVFGSWQWNYFISAPVFSTLVSGISQPKFVGKLFDQQAMVDKACEHVSDTENQSYYPLSWQVIAKMTLNGDVAKAGALFAQPTTPAPVSPTLHPMSPSPTVNPTDVPTKPPTVPEPTAMTPTTKPTSSATSSSPTQKPTMKPTNVPTATKNTDLPTTSVTSTNCCTFDFYHCSADNWCNESEDNCHLSCGGAWIENTDPSMECIAKYKMCTGDIDACCGELMCKGNEHYRQCV